MQIEIQIPKAVLFDVKYTVEQATNFAKKEVALGFYMQKGVSVALCSQIAGMSEKEFAFGTLLCKISRELIIPNADKFCRIKQRIAEVTGTTLFHVRITAVKLT